VQLRRLPHWTGYRGRKTWLLASGSLLRLVAANAAPRSVE
jgi:hypothetical protein